MNKKKIIKKSVVTIIMIKVILILTIVIVLLNNKERIRVAAFVNYRRNIKKTAWIGIEVLPVDPGIARKYGFSSRGGLLVRKVFADSPAEKAGIKRGDVIKRIGSTRVRKLSQLKKIMQKTGAGKRLMIIIDRMNGTKILCMYTEPRPAYLADPNLVQTAYYSYPRQYQPPVNRPYPYFTFSGEQDENEMERE